MREQLNEALRETGVSVRELSVRLDPTRAEARRRWLLKILAGKVARPRPASLRRIEKALGLPEGHFDVPAQQQAREQAATHGEVVRRLEEVEKTLTELTEALSVEAPKADARIRRLERLVLPDSGQEGHEVPE